MAGRDPSVAQSRRDRQIDARLADIVCRIGEQFGAAFGEFGAAGARPDRDAVAAGLADRLDDKSVEMVERIAQRLCLAADICLNIGQDRLLVR